MTYTNQGHPHGEYGIYQGRNTDAPLATGSYEECVDWCKSSFFRFNADTKTWDSGIGPSRARHHIAKITD